MASVDVIVPCYNYGRFLRDCVGSVLTQEAVAVRVLIIDDCSSDDSEQVGRSLAAADARVEYRRHAVNRGHVATYNEGLDWLASEYCLLLSADDMLTPGALARAAAVLDAHPEVAFAHGRAISTAHPELACDQVVETGAVTVLTGPEFIRTRCEAGHNLVETPTVVGRTAVQRRAGHYRADLPHSCDMEMWLRHAVHGSVAYLHAHQAFYRTHGGNMSTGYRDVRDLQQVKLAFDRFFDAYGAQVPDSAGLRAVAGKRVAANAFEIAYHAFLVGKYQLYADCGRLARAADPGCRFSLRWNRLRLKRLLGSRTWNRLRASRRWLGRRTACPPSPGVRP